MIKSTALFVLAGLMEIGGGWLVWLSLPLAISLIRAIHRDTGRALNKTLVGTARLELVYALLLSAGLIAGRLW